MDKFFVYYNDDYYENGGVGFAKFETKAEALSFIEQRLQSAKQALTNYTLVKGVELPLTPVSTITKITA